MKVSDLRPSKENPRVMSSDKKENLKASLLEFGDLSGIVYNVKLKELVSGHQRSSVLPKNAKIEIDFSYPTPTKVGTVREGSILDNGERIKYREVSWPKKKHNAAMIAANRHSGDWDTEKLKSIVNELNSEGYKMTLTGLDNHELDSMIEQSIKKVEKSLVDMKVQEMAQKHEEESPAAPPQEVIEEEKESAFESVVEKTEIEGKRHVIIIDCPSQEAKEALKEKLRKEIIEQFGAKIF